jgi:hypothetical protein
MSQYTLQRLRELKLSGMAHNLEQQLDQPGPYDELLFTDRLTLMLDEEYQSREQRKHTRLIKQARFKLQTCKASTMAAAVASTKARLAN